MSLHFSANLYPVVKERTAMLYWIMDPAVLGVVIAYDLSGNQVLLHQYDVSTVNSILMELIVAFRVLSGVFHPGTMPRYHPRSSRLRCTLRISQLRTLEDEVASSEGVQPGQDHSLRRCRA
jgi:hypothetical protein